MREPLLDIKIAVIGADKDIKDHAYQKSIITWLEGENKGVSGYHFIIDLRESGCAVITTYSTKFKVKVSDSDKRYMLNAFVALNVDTIDLGEIDFADQISVYYPSCEYRRTASDTSDVEEAKRNLQDILPDRISSIIVFIVLKSDANEFSKALIMEGNLADIVKDRLISSDPDMDVMWAVTSLDDVSGNVEYSIWYR